MPTEGPAVAGKLGDVAEVREALNDGKEKIPQSVIERQLSAARVKVDHEAGPNATDKQLTEAVIAVAARKVVGSDVLTKQKGGDGETITWDTAGLRDDVEREAKEAIEVVRGFWAV